jgi:hypothetical protein
MQQLGVKFIGAGNSRAGYSVGQMAAKNEMTPKEVAQWMLDQMGGSDLLYQDSIAERIETSCGEEFVYKNKNGKRGIRKAVLAEFRKLTQGQLVWVLSERAWRRK